MRVRNEWSDLHRHPNESILDFEARWDDKLKKMKRAGLERTQDEMLIDYLNKVGVNYSKLIRFDRRDYEDGKGTRVPCSWNEAHLIAYEIEKHSRDSEAIRKETGSSRQGAISLAGSIAEAEGGHPPWEPHGPWAAGSHGRSSAAAHSLLRP